MLLAGLLPACPFKNALLRMLGGYRIGPRVTVRPCLLLGVERLVLQEGCRIGLLTVLRDLRSAELGRDAKMGSFNWVTAARELRHQSPAAACFTLADGAAVTSRHYVDCSGGVVVGRYSTVAGVRSVIMSHGIDTDRCEQVGTQITIGEYCLIASTVRIVPGVTVADRSVVAMGSVVSRSLTETDCLYAGVPAVKKRCVAGAYFSRQEPYVRARS